MGLTTVTPGQADVAIVLQRHLEPLPRSFRPDYVVSRARLGLTLMWLATGDGYASLARAWGIGISTVAGIIRHTVRALPSPYIAAQAVRHIITWGPCGITHERH